MDVWWADGRGDLKEITVMVWNNSRHFMPNPGSFRGGGGCSKMVFSERRTPRLTPMGPEVGLDMPRKWTTVGLGGGPRSISRGGPRKITKVLLLFL